MLLCNSSRWSDFVLSHEKGEDFLVKLDIWDPPCPDFQRALGPLDLHDFVSYGPQTHKRPCIKKSSHNMKHFPPAKIIQSLKHKIHSTKYQKYASKYQQKNTINEFILPIIKFILSHFLLPKDNRILGEGLVQEKQTGYLRKACFCSNFDFPDEKKTSWLRKVQM